MVLPDNPKPQEVFSLLRLVLHMGQLAGDSSVKLATDFISALDENAVSAFLLPEFKSLVSGKLASISEIHAQKLLKF